jgi:hypothetical protein
MFFTFHMAYLTNPRHTQNGNNQYNVRTNRQTVHRNNVYDILCFFQNRQHIHHEPDEENRIRKIIKW